MREAALPRREAALPLGEGPLPLVALFGPTGVGKTAVAIALAERLRAGGEDPIAVSADALQLYAGLDTLTGAPSAEERQRLEHRLVGCVPLTETFSVGAYMSLAHAEIDAALAAGRRPIVVGGTGLYLRAALSELELAPSPPPELRERIVREIEARGAPALHERLASHAPDAARDIDPRDRTRVARALELVEMNALRPKAAREGSELWSRSTRHPTALIGLVMERAELYEAIDRRVEAMVAAGAVEEVRRAEAAGASATVRKALGFRELLAGDVEAMRRRTRNYARRQLTWMRKLPGVRLLDLTARTPAEAASEVTMSLEPWRARE